MAGDGLERRKALNYDLLAFGDGLMAASQLLHTRELQLINSFNASTLWRFNVPTLPRPCNHATNSATV